MNATEPVTRLRRELGALDRAYSEGHHGLWSAARRSDLFDAALRELFEAPGAPAGVALAAIGGYGRRQQLPRSDVDLLVLHEGDRLDEVAALVERLLYPLWDAGFEVGHAVRTAEECVVAARERLDGLTSMLDLRHLAGDRELADRAGASVRAIAADDPDGFAEVLRADARARNERVGPAASMLQPDLKSGAGGLRDLQSLRWFEAVSGVRSGGCRPAASAGTDGAGGRRGVPHQGPKRAPSRDRQAGRCPPARAAATDRQSDGLHRRTQAPGRGRADAGGVRTRSRRPMDHGATCGTACPQVWRRGRCRRSMGPPGCSKPSPTPLRPMYRRRPRCSMRSRTSIWRPRSSGPRRSAEPSCGCSDVARPAYRRSRRSTVSVCWCGSSPRGRTCDAVRNATPTTGSPSMCTSPRRGRRCIGC